MGRKIQTNTRDTVVAVRLDRTSLTAVDLLVQAGLAQSRSEAASQLISLGIQHSESLLNRARTIAETVQQVKQDMIEAVKTRNVEVVQTLLQTDSGLANAKNQRGESAVLMSAYYHAEDIRDLLLQEQPTLDFFEACAVGNTSRVQELLDENPSLTNQHNSDGFTPLGLAAFFGHAETAKLLISRAADVNQLSVDGKLNNTPLHAASAGHHTEIVNMLLMNGANVDARQTGWLRPGFTPLHVAAGRGFKDVAMVLLDNHADLGVTNDDGQTPREHAIACGCDEFARWLGDLGTIDE